MAKFVKCPDCGEEFKKPLFGQKRFGIGISITGLGDYTCPKCGYKGQISTFVVVEKDASSK
jgi:DNA-directed RNA polymerase subunit RPC12/RpoP